MTGIVAVAPHDGGSLESLDATIAALPGGGPLHRLAGEVWVDAAGMVYAKVSNAWLVVEAIKHQGYAGDAFNVTGVVNLPSDGGE